MNLIVKGGSTKQRWRLMFIDANDDHGRGMIGLNHQSLGIQATFIREGDAAPSSIELASAVVGRFTRGGFVEIDPERMPGLYEFHPPDEVLAGGSDSAVVMISLPEARPLVITIDLVGYDPHDSERLGLSCLSQESRHACLASAFQEVIPQIIEGRRTGESS